MRKTVVKGIRLAKTVTFTIISFILILTFFGRTNIGPQDSTTLSMLFIAGMAIVSVFFGILCTRLNYNEVSYRNAILWLLRTLAACLIIGAGSKDAFAFILFPIGLALAIRDAYVEFRDSDKVDRRKEKIRDAYGSKGWADPNDLNNL